MGALVAFEKIVPVALVFGGGVMFARRGVIDATSSKAFADFAFFVRRACYLFGNIYHIDLDALFQWRALTPTGLPRSPGRQWSRWLRG